MHAMMVYAELHEKLKTGIWSRCEATETTLEIIMVNPTEEKCAHEMYYSKIKDYTKVLSNFKETGDVLSIINVKTKK